MYALTGVLTLSAVAVSCKKEDKGPAPTDINASSLMTESQEGKVKISWTVPDKANYKYIRVTYMHPDTKKEHVRLASIHADHILIDGLLGRHGDITFKLVPVSATGVEGKTETVTAAALPLPKMIQVNQSTKAQAQFAAEESVWASSIEASEGSLAGLVDGNPSTYLHGKWSNHAKSVGGPMPNYFVVKLAAPTRAFNFLMQNRHNKGADAPKEFDVLVSNTFALADIKNPEKHNAVEVVSFGAGTTSNTAGAAWTSPVQILDQPYQYVWIKVKSLHSGKNFPTLAELQFWTYKLNSYDPETDQTEEL